MDADRRAALIEAALRSLPQHRRTPLALYHFEEMSYEEIASRLGATVAKVKSDIFRARVTLARKLARSELAPDSLPETQP